MERIAWGAKVSETFLDRCKWIVEDLQIGVSTSDGMSKLLSCIAWESGRTFSASVVNKAGSGATGLIQFMPATAKALGTTTAALAKMKAEDQLNYVWKYFAPYKGKLKSLSDLYMAILWPKAIGKPETYVLWDKSAMPTTYRQNAGLDINADGGIIKAEASAKLNAMLAEGMTAKNSIEYCASATAYKAHEPLVDNEYNSPDTLEHIVVDKAAEVLTRANSVPSEVTQRVEEVKTDAAIVTTIVEPNDVLTKIKRGVSGAPGNFAGVAAIAGALLLDPNFSKLLGAVTTAFATGEGRTGAVMALIGAGLIAYRTKGKTTTP